MAMIAYLILILLLPGAMAHGVGNEQGQVSGDYYFELGHDPGELNERTPSTLSLAIHNATTNGSVAPGKVWIRISKGDDIYLASSGFLAEDSPLFIDYIFAEEGTYTIDARRDSESASFTLDVGNNPTDVSMQRGLVMGSAILTLIIVLYLRNKLK